MLNLYVLNSVFSKYIKSKLTKLKEKTDKCTIIVGDFKVFFSQ